VLLAKWGAAGRHFSRDIKDKVQVLDGYVVEGSGEMSDEVERVGALEGTRRYVPKAPVNQPGKRERRLNYRMRMLVENFLANGGNAAQAARDVGYGDPESAGPHKMKHPTVQALLKQRLESIGVDRDEVIGSLVMMMRENASSSDPAEVANAVLAASELCRIFGLNQVRVGRRRRGMRGLFCDMEG
jgi:hypothetical protein